MVEKFGGPKNERENEVVANAVSMIHHHISTFLLASRDATYAENSLRKGQDELSKLLAEAKNPAILSKAQELAGILRAITPGDKADNTALEEIGKSLDAIGTERTY